MNIYKKRKKVKFSIICATYGNNSKILDLCYSLNNQKYKNFELLICDQNKNNFNKDSINLYKKLDIKFLKTKVGLSIARNRGIRNAKGDYLIFLDDDMVLKKNFTDKLNNLLNKTRHNILAYTIKNQSGEFLLNYPKLDCFLKSTYQIFTSISSVSFTISNKRKIYFDQNIGLGSKKIYQSGEETDLILRAIKRFKYKIYFKKSIFAIHNKKKLPLLQGIKKAFFYGCGWSFVVKKNNLKYFFIIQSFLRILLNIGYNILTLNFKKTMISVSTIIGRFYGLF